MNTYLFIRSVIFFVGQYFLKLHDLIGSKEVYFVECSPEYPYDTYIVCYEMFFVTKDDTISEHNEFTILSESQYICYHEMM